MRISRELGPDIGTTRRRDVGSSASGNAMKVKTRQNVFEYKVG